MLRLPFAGKSPGNTQNDTTLISAGTLIEGDLTFTGTLELEGRVIGDIRAGADTHAVVRILPGGQVLGDICAPIVVVNGEVSGNVQSSEHVELAAAAVVHGDVEYSLIEMTRGAQINGRLVYRAPATAGERLVPALTAQSGGDNDGTNS